MAKPVQYRPFTKPRRKWYGPKEEIVPRSMRQLTSRAWRAAEDVKEGQLKRQLKS